jgi:CspA family cold shock protein
MFDREPGFSRAEEAPTGRRVDAKVKWFNATKGFGFVTIPDGSQDAFLPMAILRRAGYDDVREGASITCEVGAGAKGPVVLNVLNIDNSTAAEGGERRAARPASTLDGAVKWFVADKGYGFIAPDGGGKDVFIHVTALRRSGLSGLDAGQRVRVEVVDGKKGLEADRVTLL